MNRKLQFVSLTAIVAVSVTVGMFLASGFNLTPATSANPAVASGASPAALPSFAEIAERANPAVVSITSTSMVPERGGQRGYRDPFEFFFGPNPDRRRRDEAPPSEEDPQEDSPERREDSGGSGFIISDDGYVLTNFHVVENASRVEVRLADDAREWKAEIIGTDEATDLALIKIDAGKKLPTIPLGDSERIRVGEWVVAIGNPLAWEHTVTVGVVSAKGRRLVGLNRDGSLDDFIQTDAAINFGNSGGPLLNIAGEAIGINTAISSQGQGIGFAIPINMAKQIMDQLKERGRVSRGYLGIQIQDINRLPPEERESFGLLEAKGAFVESAEKNLPAWTAGIRPGDAIIAVDGTRQPSRVFRNHTKPPPSCTDCTYAFRYIRSMHSSANVTCFSSISATELRTMISELLEHAAHVAIDPKRVYYFGGGINPSRCPGAPLSRY